MVVGTFHCKHCGEDFTSRVEFPEKCSKCAVHNWDREPGLTSKDIVGKLQGHAYLARQGHVNINMGKTGSTRIWRFGG